MSNHEALVKEEREILNRLQQSLRSMDAPRDALDLISDLQARLNSLFVVVVVGEYNAGKSTFINSLLGKQYLESGVLPTTNRVAIIRNASDGPERTQPLFLQDVDEIFLPLQWLRYVAIVDTPGTNSIISGHDELTKKVVPRSDLVIFVTSVERPLSESEAQFLRTIREWGKKVVTVVNKVDILPSQYDQEMVLAHVSQNVRSILGISSAPVFRVSSRVALNERIAHACSEDSSGVARMSDRSGILHLESYLKEALGGNGILKAKLESAAITAERLVSKLLESFERDAEKNRSDSRVIEMIQQTSVEFNNDLEKELLFFNKHLAKAMQQDEMRIVKTFIQGFNTSALFTGDKLKATLTTDTTIDRARPIFETIDEVSEFLCQRSKTQAKLGTEYIGDRYRRFSSNLVGVIKDKEFDAEKYALTEKCRGSVTDAVVHMDKEKDQAINAAVANIYRSASIAAGISLFSALASGSAVWLAPPLLAPLPLWGAEFVAVVSISAGATLAAHRYAIMRRFRTKIASDSAELLEVFSASVQKGRHQFNGRIADATGPYVRAVRVEEDKLNAFSVELRGHQEALRNFRSRLGSD